MKQIQRKVKVRYYIEYDCPADRRADRDTYGALAVFENREGNFYGTLDAVANEFRAACTPILTTVWSSYLKTHCRRTTRAHVAIWQPGIVKMVEG